MEEPGLKGFLYLELIITAFLVALISLLLFGWHSRFWGVNRSLIKYYQQKNDTVNKLESDSGQIQYVTGNLTVKRADEILYLSVN